LKYFRDSAANTSSSKLMRRWVLGAFALAIAGSLAAMGELPSWIRKIESASAIEAAFFRMMSLPGGAVPFRRPPSETRPALTELIKTQPHNADLYSLRALEDEQQLDFAAAESDWKAYAVNSSDKVNAELALADFYHRRLRPGEEINALSLVATAPPIAAETLTPPSDQQSWRAFERIFGIVEDQGLPKDVSIAQYRAWIARYPQESSLYARFLQLLVAQKEYAAASQLIASYGKQFPADQVFPVKAKAMVEYRQGSVREGLAVYEQSFQPLWDPELVKSYFDLLRETQSLRKFLDQARAAQNANPEDLNAMARIFYYYQQQGKLDAAQQAVADFRLHKEASKSTWTSRELYICARLLEDIHSYPESARYYFALYNSKGSGNAQAQAIAGLADILLTAPETPVRFGSGELSMYRDIATMDQGPGYLNGILSLILNTTEPASYYSEEELRAAPYFHRSRAAELIAQLDNRFPDSPDRSELHAQLLQFYAGSGESDAVIQGGREFLAAFPKAPQRTSVALLMADAYARKDDATSEFAIYDSVLKELAASAQNVPLGKSATGAEYQQPESGNAQESDASDEEEGAERSEAVEDAARSRRPNHAFEIGSTTAATAPAGPRSPEYSRVLERYLARLVQMKQIPQALSVLGGEIDRNPDDPGLYERLAAFLDQNRLGEEQEQVYRRAIAHFPDRSWYDKLSRFYLRYRRNSEFEQLTRDAIKSFSGTDLERYFQGVYGSPALNLQLNLYANQRFPHNPVFVDNLLRAYQSRETYNEAAWEALLRQHWFEEVDLRNVFFEYLSRRGRLEGELTALRQSAPDEKAWRSNPAAADFIANANLWQSHFEESAPPLKSLAAQYPAEREIADTASSVFRSLAYFDPSATSVAAKIQDNLLQANPRDTEILARIGDIYSDREQFAQAAPYWERIPRVSPGLQGGYLEAATIYWDYFDFDNALRLLNDGRDRLRNPNLYAYEAGAIYENQRDYAHAIDEYVKGSLESSGSSAESRLLQLARRPKLRELVDQSTAKIATGTNPSMSAVNLRVKVLEAQNRKPELESFLDSVISGTTTIEQAEDIENLAQEKSLEGVRQHAIEKQIALTTDPVTRLQLRYSLIRLYEARKDSASAERNIEALYRENPKILGVVRATVDFYWRTKNYPKAMSVLTKAASDSYPDLAKQFNYEAARKSTDAKRYQQARDLLAKLLEGDPYNSEYLAAVADTYAREADDHGLQQFYTDKIALFRNSSLPADTRKAQIVSLRRGLIPALTRMKDYAGAVDQYIELINNFPEDEALVTEAALYAQRYQREQQLVNFYAKTVATSPRDFHWPMVLARIQTNLEDYPAAIATYGKAIAVRPDRSDLFIGRSELENRLMRFDDAAADYERLYQLNYKDPQWMEKIAETRARQGKAPETVAALKTALIDGRPENAANYFEVARRLESWGMLADARNFAEQGTKTADADLLANGDFLNGAKTYVRIMTRLRQHDKAYDRMSTALSDAASEVNIVEQQVARQGIGAITDRQWRVRTTLSRTETAGAGMTAIMQEMGNTVNTYFTPEEKITFASFAEAKRKDKDMDTAGVASFLIPLAETAGLADQEAHWSFEVMMSRANPKSNYYPQMQALIDLQRRRGRFVELAEQMEQLAAALPRYPNGQPQAPMLAAADAYYSAGDSSNEFRLLKSAFAIGWPLDQTHEQRLFRFLLEHDPDKLVSIASRWDSVGDRATGFVLSDGNATLAHAVVQGRARIRPPVWSKSYNALVGLYFKERTADVNSAFVGALGDSTIGERISSQVDRSQQLAGGIWFYYGSRYGEYLGSTEQGDAEAFLPAAVEESPATAANYLTLADYYMGVGDTKRAIEEYEHTLDLAPGHADVYDDLALAYYKQGDRAAALAQWKLAFAELLKEINRAQVPETFWQDFGRTCDQLRTRHLFSELRPDAETIIRTYLRHNGSWRSNAVLQSPYLAVGDPASATQWLVSLSTSATDPAQVLADVADASWIPLAQRAPIYQRVLDLKTAALAGLDGTERDSAQQELADWQVRWIGYMVKTKQYAQAADAIAALPTEIRTAQSAALVPLDLRVAAQLGTLDTKLANYRAVPDDVPPSDLLRTAAKQLFEAGDKQSARKILEFVFAREIDQHQLVASNFLGLAEIRIASGDMPGALDLLRRLVAVVGNPFENLDPAAALLEKAGHNAEAIEFLGQLVKSAPWEASYQIRLAKAKLTAGQDASADGALSALAAGANNAYGIRAQAAGALAGKSHFELGSGELNFLAGNTGTSPATSADKFYFYQARIKAAQSVSDPRLKMQLLSNCITDFPRRDEARFPLFRAAVTAHKDEMALAIVQPVFQQFTESYIAPNEEDQIIGSDNGSDDNSEQGASPTTVASKLTRSQQIQVAQTLGEILVRLKRPSEALPYFRTARRLETATPNRRLLDRRIVDLRTLLRIQQQNAARQPVLHDALEQDRIVRPRLLARAAPASSHPSKGGVKQ
jgi:tetratricopeptide (TPR) repeat protein